jgi:hypothetical protein
MRTVTNQTGCSIPEEINVFDLLRHPGRCDGTSNLALAGQTLTLALALA